MNFIEICFKIILKITPDITQNWIDYLTIYHSGINLQKQSRIHLDTSIK